MEKQVIPASENPKINLDVEGSLTLKGWDEPEITIKSSSSEDLEVQQQDDELVVRCRSHCTVKAPFGAIIVVSHVGAHATIKSLDGELLIRDVAGSLTMRSVGTVTIERVSGHLTAKNIDGDLHLGRIDGSATLRDVQGDLIVEDGIYGNLTLKDIDGNAASVTYGSVTLNLDPDPGNTYNFKAHGNLLCRIPADASVNVEIPEAASLTVKIPEAGLPTPIQAPYRFTLGDGDATLTLSASGSMVISTLPPDFDMEDLEVELGKDFESMAETIKYQVAHQIEAQMEMLEHQLESQFNNLSSVLSTAGLSPEQADRLAERARETSERAQARAQEKLQRAHEKLQRKLEAARRRAEMRARTAERAARDRRRRPEPAERAPSPAMDVREPVTDEERLMILHMLEQKQITAEEAEALLAALEGKTG